MHLINNNRAFTLFEVLIAVSLVGISVALLIQSYLLINRSLKLHSNNISAIAKLEEQLFQEKFKENQYRLSEGVFEPPLNYISWKADRGNVSRGGFQNIELDVLWKGAREDNKITLVTTIRR